MKANRTLKLTKWIGSITALAALTGSNLLLAQTWETLLPSPDFAPGGTGMSALIDPFSANSANPGVFIGSATDGSGNGSLVRLDPNGTSPYKVTVVDSELLAVYELGYNPHPSSSGALYAVGIRRKVTVPPLPQNNPFIWTVRKSTTGDTWETDNTFYLSSKENAMASGFAADADGNVYVCGTATLKNVYHWIVRKLPAPSVSEPTPAWRTVSDLNVKWTAEANGMCRFSGNPLNPKAGVFAVGVIGGKWEVRRSQDQGATWVSVDSLPLTSRARNAACDSAGNIFVVGSQGSTSSRWVVRMSADGGDLWNTVLDVYDGYTNFARNVAADQQGNIWVAGSTSIGSDKYATPRWTVLRHNNNSNTPESWAASWGSRQNSFPGNYSFPVGIAADASGNNVFVTGTVQDWTDGNLNFYPGGRVAVQRLVPTP